MIEWQLRTPVVFLIFNRPDTTAKVFETIRQAKPPKLLIVADGPRPDRRGEAEKCADARLVVERGIDWPCEVLTNYSDTNLGCKRRVSSGLKWAFEEVEEAIILEDDCLPHPTFFRFCEELLQRYRDDTRIISISGDNFQFGKNATRYSYYFSRYFHCWGWATWRRVARMFDPDMPLWPEVQDDGWLSEIFETKREVEFWRKTLQRVYDGDIDSWGYAWSFMSFIQNGLNVLPAVNLVSNIGFGEVSTHTQDTETRFANMPVEGMRFPLAHPPFMVRYKQADLYTGKQSFSTAPVYFRVIKLIARLLKVVRGRLWE